MNSRPLQGETLPSPTAAHSKSIDQHIQPTKFRLRGAGPTINVSEKGALAKFDGAGLLIGLLGLHQNLVMQIREALTRLSTSTRRPTAMEPYLELGADQICKINDLHWRVIAYMNRKGYWICYPDGTLNDDRPNVFIYLRLVFTIAASGQTNSDAGRGRPNLVRSGL